MRTSIGLIAITLALVGCDAGTSADPAKAKAAQQAAVSVPDARLPAGFAIFTGGGEPVELTMAEPPTGGRIFTYSITTTPAQVIRFYEEQSAAAGMTVAGRLNAGEVLSYEARNETGTPRTFGANALRKGEFTNVTLSFDVTR